MNRLVTPQKPQYAHSDLPSGRRLRSRQLKQTRSSFSVTSFATQTSELSPILTKNRSASPARLRQDRRREEAEYSCFLDRLEYGDSEDELRWEFSSLEVSTSFEQPRTLAARCILTYYFPALKLGN